ncbi:DUF4062 domain-containing protein [Sphingomonas sp. NPDC079357]|uniref:DUF4062 domain-containing protein n=1 Tax=Sphingomonas sp. NPDC079357 TaxID=3364518 RepID=UPI00385133E7
MRAGVLLMPSNLTAYRIFIASPGGLEDFRKRFKATVEKHNDADAVRRGALFIPVGWEQTLGGMGRPQHIINADLRECDYFVVVLRDRWGSPADTTPDSLTGTEEEFELACQLYNDQAPMSRIVVVFVAIDADRMRDPGKDVAKVIEFRKKVEREKILLFHQVEREEDFADVLRRHLADWTHAHENAAAGRPEAPVEAEVASAPTPNDQIASPPAGEATGPVADAAKLIALARYTEAEALLAEAVSDHDDPPALTAYGDLLIRLGRRTQGIDSLRRAVRLAEETSDVGVAAAAYEALATALEASGQGKEGATAARSALERFAALGDAGGEARMYNLLGERHRLDHEMDNAIAHYRAAIDRATDGGAEDILADAWIGLGEVFRDQEAFGEAFDALNRGAEIKHRLGATDVGDLHAALGATLAGLGDDAGADREYRISIDLFRGRKDRAGIADAADHLGQVCLRRGDADGAEEAFREAAINFEGVQNVEGAADAYTSLGRVELVRGDKLLAARTLNTALSLARRQLGDGARAAQSEIVGLLDQALTPAETETSA